MYKDTVKKQEQVISKLETLLEKLMRERKIKDAQEAENKWKNNLETDAYYLNSQEEQLKQKLKKQETMIEDLRLQLRSREKYIGSVDGAETDVKLR